MKKKMKYNTIPQQSKTETSKISHQDWNFIINVLKEQTNYNAETLEKLFYDLGYRDQEIEKKIKEVESGLIDWEKIIEEIKNHDEIHVGKNEPTGNQKIWFELD